jgi:hypothetical protein
MAYNSHMKRKNGQDLVIYVRWSVRLAFSVLFGIIAVYAAYIYSGFPRPSDADRVAMYFFTFLVIFILIACIFVFVIARSFSTLTIGDFGFCLKSGFCRVRCRWEDIQNVLLVGGGYMPRSVLVRCVGMKNIMIRDMFCVGRDGIAEILTIEAKNNGNTNAERFDVNNQNFLQKNSGQILFIAVAPFVIFLIFLIVVLYLRHR